MDEIKTKADQLLLEVFSTDLDLLFSPSLLVFLAKRFAGLTRIFEVSEFLCYPVRPENKLDYIPFSRPCQERVW